MAQAISIILHPFVMIGVLVGTAAAARQSAGDATRAVALVAMFTVVPLLILVVRQVKRGTWENADASNRAERPVLYGVAGAALATIWVKVSLHMAFATLAASALTLGRSPVGYLITLLLPALIWSRLTLKRHLAAEVALGALIGCAAGASMHFL